MSTVEVTSHHVHGKKHNNGIVAHVDPEVAPVCRDYSVTFSGGDQIKGLQFASLDTPGLHNEDLIAISIDRLERFQETKFRCRENAIAITKLQEAQLWLSKRSAGRIERGVEHSNKE